MGTYHDQNTRFGYPTGPIEEEGAIPRLMFGMDLCRPQDERSSKPLLPPYLRELRDRGEISATVFEKVARGNAIRELRLG